MFTYKPEELSVFDRARNNEKLDIVCSEVQLLKVKSAFSKFSSKQKKNKKKQQLKTSGGSCTCAIQHEQRAKNKRIHPTVLQKYSVSVRKLEPSPPLGRSCSLVAAPVNRRACDEVISKAINGL